MFVTEDYPPFNYVENGTIQGIAVDLLRGVAKEMGDVNSPDNIMVVPWSKAWATTLERNNTVLFATVRLPEREELFKWAGPLGSERKVIFARQGTSPEITGPDDLAGYLIGVVRDDAAYGELLALGVGKEQLIEMGNVPALISLIQDGEIDFWCYGDLAGRYFAEKETGDPDYFEIVYTLDTHDLYFAFNRNTPDSVVQAFQEALDTLRYQPDEAGVIEYQRIAYQYIGVSCLSHPPVTADQVKGLVNFTAEAMEKDAPGTLARINSGEHPFWDRDNRALYVFVYDTNVTIIAEADNPRLIGVNMVGKTDIAGTPFRDLIINKALAEGTGWVDYIWMIPEENGIYQKSAYFRLVKGNNDNRYIVVSGMYIPCKQD
ncbi:MAG TPA: transporter substrate-binding domain-containing protein [Methanoregulaceae archaeon]|nr:transporter substrate-binding domain-containing protein [Methanoregulaceae archaeon]